MWSTGINRNIVECKATFVTHLHLSPARINRNIVECKVYYNAFTAARSPVLIETLWNVKSDLYNVLNVLYGY